jgi:hypothetical protein
MSNREAKQNAERFLKEQAAIMKRHGDTPKMSGDVYKTALVQTTKTFQSLSEAKPSAKPRQ